MMLLIEDRPIRQQLFIHSTGIDLNAYSDVLDNKVDEEHHELIEKIKNSTFNFDKYSIIACHRSAFGDNNIEILNKIENYCSTNNKPLILFTGNLDVNYYDNSENEKMEIGSKIFYSDHLQLYLDELRKNNENILIFPYGKQWKTNIFLNALEKINKSMEENPEEKISFKRFARDTGLSNLYNMNLDIYKPNIEGKFTSVDEIKKIVLDLEKDIRKAAIDA